MGGSRCDPRAIAVHSTVSSLQASHALSPVNKGCRSVARKIVGIVPDICNGPPFAVLEGMAPKWSPFALTCGPDRMVSEE